MVTIKESFIVISKRERTRSEQKRVEERIKADKCLMKKHDANEDLVDCDSSMTASCGNCTACQKALKDFLAALPPEQAAVKEQEVISRGWRLAPQEIRAIKSAYAFSRLGA